ncbi:hypothetical protein L1277_002277 [Okibacterium sp. HSC-33S16]|uniref:hypothetical protein n=1 Tax=Okibacterium sp. HSC-33S16 TaxID=2910965 RepID=UPI00209E95F5|nr:hypothetical protein [Okibacterium sp. HSC-33S16]MCP2032178.1 hypothetical protein [Okibacterium sp. HSC-33S16]
MKRIHYAGTSFVTGDAIARALIDLARALTEKNHSDVVEVPIARNDGSPGRVEILITPGGMVFESEPTLVRDIVDEALIDDLRQRAAQLLATRPPDGWQAQQAEATGLYSDVHSFA